MVIGLSTNSDIFMNLEYISPLLNMYGTTLQKNCGDLISFYPDDGHFILWLKT